MSLCAALVLGVHLGTYHFQRGKYSDNTPGIYATCDNVTLGTFKNSNGDRSNYAAYNFQRVIGPFDLAVGGVTGYSEKIRPLLVPSYRFDSGVRLAFIIPANAGKGAGVHVSYEF